MTQHLCGEACDPQAERETHPLVATCGGCGLSWNDAIITSMTPAPSARCPFEYFHIYGDQDEVIGVESIPDDWPVKPLGHGSHGETREEKLLENAREDMIADREANEGSEWFR